jgi:hypothetical protein
MSYYDEICYLKKKLAKPNKKIPYLEYRTMLYSIGYHIFVGGKVEDENGNTTFRHSCELHLLMSKVHFRLCEFKESLDEISWAYKSDNYSVEVSDWIDQFRAELGDYLLEKDYKHSSHASLKAIYNELKDLKLLDEKLEKGFAIAFNHFGDDDECKKILANSLVNNTIKVAA